MRTEQKHPEAWPYQTASASLLPAMLHHTSENPTGLFTSLRSLFESFKWIEIADRLEKRSTSAKGNVPKHKGC